ncbi:MAG: PepSY-associated TM helix domain-containing protein [Pseudohongiellaceae bacterium]
MAINRNLVSWSRTVHIYLSIALLLVLIFFSVTGITLNHATSLTAEPETSVQMLDGIPELPRDENDLIIASPELESFIRQQFGVRLSQASMIHEDDLLIIDYRAPGKIGYIEFDLVFDEIFAETTDYGLIAALNDLHKARDTTVIWNWLIDISGVILVVFSLAGFVLLLPNKYRLKKVSRYTVVALGILTAGYYLGNL